MTRTEPTIIRRGRQSKGTVVLNPLSCNVIGTQPLVSLILDCGDDTYSVRLPTDLQAYVARKLTDKLQRTTQHA